MVTQILIISIFCNGIHICLNDGMILGFLYRFFKKHVKSEFWRKPLYDCIYCMASFWGIPAYVILNINCLNWLTFAQLPIIIFGCVFMNGVLAEILEAVIDYRKHLLSKKDGSI